MRLLTLMLAAELMLAPAKAVPGSEHPAGLETLEAQQHFTTGMDAWLAEDYEQASRQFAAAYALEPAPLLLYSLGQLARLQGDCESAVGYFERFLETDPAPQAAEDTRVNLERCESELPPEPPPPEPPPPVIRPPEPSEPAPVPEEPKGPDALGISLTIGGAVITGVGMGVFGASFLRQRSAEQANTVSDFDTGIARAQSMHTAGLAVAAVGAAVLIGGVVRLVLVRQRRAAQR